MHSRIRSIRDEIRAQRLGLSIGVLALFVALGGPAAANQAASSAAKLITGKQVKDRSLTLSDLSADTVRSLQGKAGPAGQPGASGEPGAPGAAGPQGVEGPRGPSSADATPQDIVTKVVDADGPGSLIDADLLDGKSSDFFAPFASALMDGDAAGGDLSGSFPSPQLQSNSVGAAEIAPDSVGSAEIAPDSVSGTDIVNSTIDETDLNAGSVTSSEIASGGVARSELRSGGANSSLTFSYPAITGGTCVDIPFNANQADTGEIAIPLVDGTLPTGLYLVPTIVQQTGIAWLQLCNGSGSQAGASSFGFNIDFIGA